MANQSLVDVLQASLQALQAGKRAALLTVLQATGSTPRGVGAKMVLLEDGATAGTIGGGTLEEQAVLDARRLLASGGTAIFHYDITGKDDASLGLCGGAEDVAIEVLQPAPRLVIFGAGHIAQPLAAMAGMIGMDVIVLDDRPEWVTAERFATARSLHVVSYDRASETLAPIPVEITPATAVVLATWGWDEPALVQVLPSPAFYIGLVASRRKLKLLGARLAQRGFAANALDRVHAPAGLHLGGDTPGEIALSILAEIQMTRRGATGQSLRSLRKTG